MNDKFKIICIRSSKSISAGTRIEKGEIFDIDEYNFNYNSNSRFDLIRLFSNDDNTIGVIGLFPRSHFQRLNEYREAQIKRLLENKYTI